MIPLAQSPHFRYWLSEKRLSWLSFVLIVPLVATIVALGAPAKGLQVQVNPQAPRLGDTLSVVIESNSAQSENIKVSLQNQSYSAFPIGSNRFRAFIPTTPLNQPKTLMLELSADGEIKKLPVVLRSRTFPVQRITLPPGKAGVDATQLELNRVAAFKKLVTPEKYWNGSFLAPNRGRLSTGYGVRRYYNGKFAQDYYHRGVDYAGGYGSPVIAPAAGKVALVGQEKAGFRVHGNVVGVDHGQGVTSIFMHLSRINVKEGDFVKAGQVIGAIGSTGASTGPHLHWGLYVNGLSVDPAPWRTTGFE